MFDLHLPEGASLRFEQRLNFPAPPPAPPPAPASAPATQAQDHISELLDFYVAVASADADARDSMWQDIKGGEDHSSVTELKRALLQSYPDHSGFDLVAGRRRLQALVRSGPPDVALVAKLRLAEMSQSLQCMADVLDLRRRLAEITDIERQLNRGKW